MISRSKNIIWCHKELSHFTSAGLKEKPRNPCCPIKQLLCKFGSCGQSSLLTAGMYVVVCVRERSISSSAVDAVFQHHHE